jgi:predicted ATPase/class 3 adenylate cyclase
MGTVSDAIAATTEQDSFIDRVLMFTDIEASSRRWEAEPDAMRALMRHHDELVSSVVKHFGGLVGARTGDGAIALFLTATDAARSALELQALIAEGPLAADIATEPLRVRVGLHRGVVERRDGEHYGPPMHRAARVMAAGHGGQILISAVVAEELRAGLSADPASIEFTIVSRGIQRLKGFHEPERLSELRRPDASIENRGLRDVAAVGNLPPIDVEAFVGRDAEVSRILPEIRAGKITTLVGTGGVGKTRLALQIAHLAQDHFQDGVWFVDLASVSSAERVAIALADTIGVAEEATQSLSSSLRHALHTRQMLVVLDNCEHVFDSVTALIRTACSDRMPTTILATSQRGLTVAGERIEMIGPLPCIAAVGANLDDTPAAGMFVLAATRGDATFVVGPGDASVIGQICRRLDGLPLALELAAARVRVMSVVEIANQLETSFDLLRSRDGAERHRTMSAAISWSIDLLSSEDRSMLVDLSVFNGDFTWEGASAVSGLDRFNVVDSLEELARRSLLVRRGGGLRMLVPLRLFCRAELTANGREPEVLARHAAWVRDSLPVPFDHLDPHVVASRLDRVINASEDIDAAHRWFVANQIEDAVAMSMLLADAHIARARYSVALTRFMDCDVDSTPVALRVEVLGWMAAFAWTLGRYDEGDAAAGRALAMADEHQLALPPMAAVLRCAFSSAEKARDLADTLERQLRNAGDGGRADMARHFPALGVVFAVAGDPDHGALICDEGVAEARHVGVLLLVNGLGNRMMIQPGSDEVAELTLEVLGLARTIDRRWTLAQAYGAIAHRARRLGDIPAFLSGVDHFAELVLDEDPVQVVQMLHWVPKAVAARFPRETAVMTAALEALGEKEHYIGAEKERARRAMLREQLLGVLGDRELERAWTEGSQLGLVQVLDRLRWMADAY